MRISIKKQFISTYESLVHKTSAHRAKGIWPLATRFSVNKGFENDAGSTLLRIGEMHRLNHEEVKQFVCHLQNWLDNGSLKIK